MFISQRLGGSSLEFIASRVLALVHYTQALGYAELTIPCFGAIMGRFVNISLLGIFAAKHAEKDWSLKNYDVP
ncbi:hypothetical protein IMCC26134_02950 [Verrucomicrobia bacterium IMCC26134]|nr:hypothetical protein IMCC26134_02950 [Verrucomicrobia bacterium IMCC26134]